MNIVLSYSGGLDSTVLLYQLVAHGHHVRALSVDYGQRHVREIRAARRICAQLGVEHRHADLSGIRPLLAGSALTDDVAVPTGEYSLDAIRATVVPNRNMLLLATCIAWAVSTRSDAVAYAAHAGDHAIYADCRPEFAEAMARAAALCDERPIELLRPLIDLTKADIVRLGATLGVPFAETWSCYVGGEFQCGECPTCVERREAFALANVDDPTHYAIALSA